MVSLQLLPSTYAELLRSPPLGKLRQLAVWYWRCSKTHRGSPSWNASCGVPQVLGRVPVPKLCFLSLETAQQNTGTPEVLEQKLGE